MHLFARVLVAIRAPALLLFAIGLVSAPIPDADAADMRAKKPPGRYDFAVRIPDALSRPVVFVVGGRSYEGGSAAVAALRADIEKDLSGVVKAANPTGTRLRIVLPRLEKNAAGQPGDGARSDEVRPFVMEIQTMLDQARVEAVRRSDLFAQVTVEVADVSLPGPAGHDYVMWRDGGYWLIRHGEGPRSMLFIANEGIAAWVKLLPRAVAEARKVAQSDARFLRTLFLGGRHIFSYAGKEYISVADLEKAMIADMVGNARKVQPAAHPLGGNARIVLATQLKAPKFGPRQGLEVTLAELTFHRAIALGKVAAIKASGLFDRVVVETADVLDLSADGYDVVIWQVGNQPTTWLFRIAGKGDAMKLSPVQDHDGWVASIRDQVANQGYHASPARPEKPLKGPENRERDT